MLCIDRQSFHSVEIVNKISYTEGTTKNEENKRMETFFLIGILII